MRRTPLRTILALLVPLGAAGCISLSRPAPQTYDYQLSYPPPPVQGQALPVVLHVSPLRIASVYNHESIVYRDGPYSTGTYYYHRWSAYPSDMITDLLARDLSASNLYRAVQKGPSVITSDYDLSGDIESIEENTTDHRCSAHLRLRVLLTRIEPAANTPVLLNHEYEASEPCTSARPADFVAAMSNAMAKVSAEVQRDVYAAIAKEVESRQSRVKSKETS